MYYIGYDIGSSSIKAALVDASTRKEVAVVQYPEDEMTIHSAHPGWAEQQPEQWWENVQYATKKLLAAVGNIGSDSIAAIGIAYQMHGLVVVDKNQKVLRPAIIWCDSRAVEIGNKSFKAVGEENCLSHLLNSPGNFTASKLKWVQENEPETYKKIHKIMLPGDFIAMKMTGEITTTVSGLSEGIMWDFKKDQLAGLILENMKIEPSLIPEIKPTFSVSGELSADAANYLGLKAGTPVAYRAGDQPNNAMSLGVLEPGQIAATGGTSGVVFGVSDQLVYDKASRINSFAHVNHTAAQPRIGSLLNINGAGIAYKWIKNITDGKAMTYPEMEKLAQTVPVGADGLKILPFGNGSERIFENKDPGSQIINLQFNRHDKAHLYRASLEGIAYSFVYGVKILEQLGTPVNHLKVGNDNLFQSTVFSKTIATLLNCSIEIIDTTGAAGAAKGAGFALDNYENLAEATAGSNVVAIVDPDNNPSYQQTYEDWVVELQKNELIASSEE